MIKTIKKNIIALACVLIASSCIGQEFNEEGAELIEESTITQDTSVDNKFDYVEEQATEAIIASSASSVDEESPTVTSEDTYYELDTSKFNMIGEYSSTTSSDILKIYEDNKDVFDLGKLNGFANVGDVTILRCFDPSEPFGVNVPEIFLVSNEKNIFKIEQAYLTDPYFTMSGNSLCMYDYIVSNGFIHICYYEFDLDNGDLISEYIEFYDLKNKGVPHRVISTNSNFKSFKEVEDKFLESSNEMYIICYYDPKDA